MLRTQFTQIHTWVKDWAMSFERLWAFTAQLLLVLLLCFSSGFICAEESILFTLPSAPLAFSGVLLLFLFNRLLDLLLCIPALGNTPTTGDDVLAGYDPPSFDSLSVDVCFESSLCDVSLNLESWDPPALLLPTLHLQLPAQPVFYTWMVAAALCFSFFEFFRNNLCQLFVPCLGLL